MKYARIATFAVLAALASGLSACGGKSQAVGTMGSIIVLATDSLWAQIGDSVMTSLEPRIYTVREERTFEVTHVAPSDPQWSEMRNFRQVLSIGAAGDPWVQPVLEEAQATGGIVQTDDVWARNQFVTAVVLPESNAAAAALDLLPQVSAAIDSAFRTYATQRMYMSGVDSVLADSLRSAAGYSLLMPNVYADMSRGPDVSLFQNSTQVGGDLVRSVLVTSREGIQPPEAAPAWRDSIASQVYQPPQETNLESIVWTDPPAPAAGVEFQGIWVGTDPTWPTGGPFLARMVPCPDQNRTYLVDAWLFAPSRAKYEYMIQLQTILGTFDCA